MRSINIMSVVQEAVLTAIITTVLKAASSYFSDKYNEHQGTKEMLDSLQASLPRIQSVLKLAEQKPKVKDANLAAWLQQLKDVIYEAEDVMDDFAAIQIRDSLEHEDKVSEIATSSTRGFKNMFLSNSNVKKLKDLLGKIKEVCDGIGDLTELIELGNNSASDGSVGFSTRETSSSISKTKKIFGRDKEIELILDMILSERQDQTKSVGKNDVTEKNITDLNLMKNTSNLIANTSKKIKVNISEKGKEKAESSDSLDVTEEKVNPIGHKFSSMNFDQPPIGYERLSSGQNFFGPKHHSNPPDFKKRKYSVFIGDPIIKVLPIVGIGGIGKTTVAQVIYNHPKVTEYFDLKGWVYVTDSPEPKKILYDILCSLDLVTNKYTSPITSLSGGHDRLKRAIRKKRFLLVFDDVREEMDWINSTWKQMIEVLADGAWGSMVIVTTDSKSVASRIGTLSPVSLGYLSPEECLGLFEYNAFGQNMTKCNSEPTFKNGNHSFPLTQHQETVLKPIGEKIAKKLHGLPLVAEFIGTLLRGKTEREEWEEILESDWWDLEDARQIITPLEVSFQNLDSDLKQCFIYCSLFPRNYVFDKDRLVQMWISHSFIHPTVKEKEKLEKGEIKIEDIGRSKFDKLVDKFLFQNATSKNKYVMHDIIREFAIAISTEMLYASGNYLKANKKIPPSIRHLAIDFGKDDDVYIDDVLWHHENITSLRTAMFFSFRKMSSDEHFSCILEKLVKLRLLDLSNFIGQITLANIGNLSHLRFLDLSFSGISEIPDSLCHLVHLQVLDLRDLRFSHLPPGMNRLINLRYLYASPETISLIHGIGRLTNLQELREFRVREKEGFTISELTNLTSLNGQLTLTDLENIPSKEKAIMAELEKKNSLMSFIFHMCRREKKKCDSTWKFDMAPYKGHMTYGYLSKNNHHHHEILEGLKPHKNIRELSIKYFKGVSFPSWVMEIHEMNNLRRIELVECLHLETLPPLGSLPSLEFLYLSRLDSITCIGKEFYGTFDVIFPSLRELTFDYMYKWKIWSDPGERKCFPCLQKLNMDFCRHLSKIPFHSLNSMVELHLKECDMVTNNVGTYLVAMTSLTRLYLRGSEGLTINFCCNNLRELRVLSLHRINIAQLDGQISSLVNLKKLSLSHYWRKSSDRQHLLGAQQAKNMDSLPSLVDIEVSSCYSIPEVLFRLGRFPSLRRLCIEFYNESEFTSSEDSWLQHLSSLEDLELSDCRSLRCLPSCISKLSSLKKLSVNNCPMICSLPKEGLPQSLMELYIIDCSYELGQGCQENTGAEWSKISHVPFIRVKCF